MMNDVLNDNFQEYGEELHDHSQVLGTLPQIGNDDQTGLYHDDSMVWDGAYNTHRSIDHNALRHEQPNPIHEVSSTDEFPIIQTSDGNLDLGLAPLGDFLNSHSLTELSEFCLKIPPNDPEQGIQHLTPGADEGVDLSPADAVVPSGNQPQSITGKIDSPAIDYHDIITEFCKHLETDEICVPPQDCSPESKYGFRYGTKSKSSIGRSELDNSEIQSNYRVVDNHYSDYLANQYEYGARAIQQPDLRRLQRTAST
jgi:hypothetical protein